MSEEKPVRSKFTKKSRTQRAYQTVLAETIYQGQYRDVQFIPCLVFENLMACECDLFFLGTSPNNKGNGDYPGFINDFQDRFEIKHPRDRQGQFYLFTLEVLKQDRQ